MLAASPASAHDPAPALEATAPEVPPVATGTPASLLEADRRLAAAASKDGLRAAIVARAIGYAVVLAPYPVGAHPYLAENELEFDKRTWESEVAEVSGSGMLGYTISRWRASTEPEGRGSKSEPATGFGRQLVVWRFHPQTSWKVLLYAAIEQPPDTGAPDSVEARKLPLLHGDHAGTHDEAHTEGVALQEFDRTLGEIAAREGWKAALAEHLAENVRWLRSGSPLVQGREAVAATLAEGACGCACTTVGARAADSADFGYTYGKCVPDTTAAGKAGAPGTGWVRVWRKDAEGVRRVAVVLEIPVSQASAAAREAAEKPTQKPGHKPAQEPTPKPAEKPTQKPEEKPDQN